MRAGSMAAAGIGETALPTPEVAIFQAQYRGRLEDSQIRRDSIQHVRREGGRKQGLLERNGTRPQRSIMSFDIKSDCAGIAPNRGIVRTPQRRHCFRERTAPGRALGLGNWEAPDLEVAIGEIPGEEDGVGPRFAWGQCSLEQNRASIPPASI